MDEPWKIYYDELRERGANIPDQRFGGADDMAEAAHETYEAVADRLVSQLGYDERDALALTRSFGQVVKTWIADETWDWDELRERLERKQALRDESAGVR